MAGKVTDEKKKGDKISAMRYLMRDLLTVCPKGTVLSKTRKSADPFTSRDVHNAFVCFFCFFISSILAVSLTHYVVAKLVQQIL